MASRVSLKVHMIQIVRQECIYFCEAIVFYTRIPGPTWAGKDPAKMVHANKYLPIIGLLVAAISALALVAASRLFPTDISIAIAMLASILITGAFHEDGLADVCDGFGGGYEREQIIRIMRDSRIGTFGVIGLISMLALKFLCLRELPLNQCILSLFISQSVSRLSSLAIMCSLPYASDQGKIKSATSTWSWRDLLMGAAVGLLPISLMPQVALMSILVFLGVFELGRRYFLRRLGGYTGDCLGAIQQITELCLLMGIVVQCRFG